MQVQSDYFNAYHHLKLTRDDKGVLVAEFHTNGGPCIMTAQSHTEFVDGFYRISQDRANKIVILTGAGGEFITDVDWSSFGNVVDPGVWSQVHGSGSDAPQHTRALHTALEGTHRARSWLRTVARRSVGIRSRQIDASQG
jgi:enoyl-CoA hydratase/carnithine racemase